MRPRRDVACAVQGDGVRGISGSPAAQPFPAQLPHLQKHMETVAYLLGERVRPSGENGIRFISQGGGRYAARI